MTITTAIRWADNTDELRRNLLHGLDTVDALRAGAERMEKAFRGEKMIQNARNITAAIDKVGVSSLNMQEATRALGTLDKAIDKMQRTGQPVPTLMRQTADALRKVTEESNRTDKATGMLGGTFGRLSTGIITVGSAIGSFLGNLAYDALRRIGSALLEVAGNGIRMAGVAQSFDRLARSIGVSGREMIDVSRTATKGLISDLDLMAAANKGILLGLPITTNSMALMAQTAVVLGKAMNQGPQKSLDDLMTALGRSSPMILDNLGLSVKVGEANAQYARSLGKSAEQLTENEKKLAFYNAAMTAAEAKVKALGGVQLTLADQMQRVRTAFTNFTDALGIAIAQSPVVNEAISSLADAMGTSFGANQVQLIQSLIGVIDQIGIAALGVAGHFVELARIGSRTWTFLRDGVLGLLEAQFRLRAFTRDLLPGKQYAEEAAVLRAMADSLRDQANEGLDRQAQLEGALDRMTSGIGATRERMIALSQAGVKQTQITDAMAGSMGRAASATATLTDEQKKLQDALFGRDLVKRALDTVSAIGDMANILRLMPEKQAEVFDQFEKGIAVLKRLGLEAPAALMAMRNALQPIVAVNTLTDNLERNLYRIQQRLLAMGNQVKASAFFPTIKTSPFDTRNLGTPVDPKQLEPPAEFAGSKVGMAFRTGFERFSAGLGQTVLNALTGGGNVARSIGALAGQSVGSSFADWYGKTLEKSGLGRMLKDILPGVGALLGGVVDWLFGPSWEEALNAFADRVAGSMDNLRAKLRMLGTEGERMWDAISKPPSKSGGRAIGQTFRDIEDSIKRLTDAQARAQKQFDLLTDAVQRFGGVAPKALQPMIDQLLKLPGLTDDMRRALEALNGPASLDALRQAAQRYGKTLDDFGQNTAQLDVSDTFDQIFSDFTMLKDAGADSTKLYENMAGAVNAALERARKLGLNVPEYMRPMLEAMLRMGLLTDEFGNQLNDLNGFTFSASIQSTMDRLAEILERIAKAMEDAVVATAPLAGPEAPVIPPGSKRSVAGGNMTVNVEMNGQTIARAITPWLPEEVVTMRLA